MGVEFGMFKRFFAVTIVYLLLMTPLAAYADLIVEPENDFFSRYENECVYLGRSFYANGANGSVSVKDKPGSNKDVTTIENGETVYIEYSCVYKGDYWGIASLYSKETSENLYGWMQMDQLLVLYDYIAFEEDHQGEFYQYKGDYDEIKKEGAAVAWPWPGSDAPLWTVESLDTTNFRVSHAYKDDMGREWGFVTYLYGSRNIWVCLSDPLNQDIPVFNPAPEPRIWVSDTSHSDVGKLESDLSVPVVIIILVMALVVGTVVLIKVFWKPNQTGRQSV